MKLIRKAYIISGLTIAINVSAQLNQTVVVESAYRPAIDNAEKMHNMPSYSDTIVNTINVDYSVLPSRIQTPYNLKPIKPAKLVGSKVGTLYNSFVNVGFGNHSVPLLECNIHNLRSKEYAVGAYAYHLTAPNKIILNNEDTVPAGYGSTILQAYGKKFYRKFNVAGDISFNNDRYKYYGYNTVRYPLQTMYPDMEHPDLKQGYTNLNAKAEIYSTIADSGRFQYYVAIKENYFYDKHDFKENHLTAPFLLGFDIKDFRAEITGNYHLFASELPKNLSNSHVVQFHPKVKKRTDQWEVTLGLNSYYLYNDSTRFQIFPNARLQFKIADEALEAYIGISGDMELNHLSKLAKENPFMKPGNSFSNTKHKLIGYGGIQGKWSSKGGYRAEIRHDMIENAYFFVNDTLAGLQNEMITYNDHVEKTTFSFETWYSPFSFLDLSFNAKYDKWKLTNLDRPWHKPGLTSHFNASYNFKEKIYADVELLHLSKRYAPGRTAEIELDPVWDMNLKVEYKYSNVLSAYASLQNVFAQEYQLWNQYPTQKLNVLIGFTYKL